jgi:hypothetical protein
MKNVFEVLSNDKSKIKVEVKKPAATPQLQQLKDIVLIKLLSGGGRK